MKRAAEEEVPPEPEKKTKLDPQAVGTEVHVSSLPWEATENHIREFFSFAGEVLRVKLLTWDEGDFAGKSKVRRTTCCYSPRELIRRCRAGLSSNSTQCMQQQRQQPRIKQR